MASNSPFRQNRNKLFISRISRFNKPVKILDVGGTEEYWDGMSSVDTNVTLANPSFFIEPKHFPFFKLSACDLSFFSDKSFDVVFSNSVIEHVGDFNNQKLMANEVRRVGNFYFLQTPNRNFPLEVHFFFPFFPFFSFFPKQIRTWLVKNGFTFSYSHITRKFSRRIIKDPKAIDELVNSIRLLNKEELLILFPDAEFIEEKAGLFTKSYIVTNIKS